MDLGWAVYVGHIVFHSCSYKYHKHYLLPSRDRMLYNICKSILLDHSRYLHYQVVSKDINRQYVMRQALQTCLIFAYY